MKTLSAVLVLGSGFHADGSLSELSQGAVILGKKVFTDINADFLIMSGFTSYKSTHLPEVSEAQAMKDYATTQGVASQNILTEAESKDTATNLLFTKINLLEPLSITHLTIVHNPYQLPARIQYLADKIIGPTATIQLTSAPLTDNPEAVQREEKSLAIAQQWLDPVVEGDAQAIYHLLRQKHPGYNKAVSTEVLTDLFL